MVLADLRGYGDSDKPRPSADSSEYAKRAMARDQLLVMRALGFDRFSVAGHDRGGRVGHRLALDAPDAVTALAVLDIVPTRHAFAHADMSFGLGYYHWFFLAAGNRIPERLIGADPEFWITARMTARHHGGTAFDPSAVAEYVRCFSDPAAIAASCADYRAAATIDLQHDEADVGRVVTAPVLALWGEHSFVGRNYDVLSVWRGYAADVRGKPCPAITTCPRNNPSWWRPHCTSSSRISGADGFQQALVGVLALLILIIAAAFFMIRYNGGKRAVRQNRSCQMGKVDWVLEGADDRSDPKPVNLAALPASKSLIVQKIRRSSGIGAKPDTVRSRVCQQWPVSMAAPMPSKYRPRAHRVYRSPGAHQTR